MNQNSGKRRLGPIHFQSEAQVTSKKVPEAPDEGGVGTASKLRLETPKGSRELKVAGPLFWFCVGLALFVAGLIFSIFLALIGIALCIFSLMTNRNYKTQRRLRS